MSGVLDIAHVEDYTAIVDELVLLNYKTVTLVYFLFKFGI